MRTIFPFVAVLALGITLAFFAGSGFNQVIDGESETQLYDEINDSASGSTGAGGTLNGSRSSSGEGSIVGLVIGGARAVFKFAGLVVLLPITLQNLNFPAWFALPVGVGFDVLLSIGLIQFVTGRIWR